MAFVGSMRNVKALLPFLFLFPSCTAISTITPTQPIKEGQTLLSPGEVFELGFFSPRTSTNRYVGIWYHSVPPQTVVWVANRENPLKDSSGVFAVSGDGNLAVLDGRGNSLWSSSTSTTSNDTTATLEDTGNLILRIGNSNSSILWESFDHPTDSFLPLMKLRADLKTGKRTILTSWKGEENPSLGSFTLGLELHMIPQMLVWNGSARYWRSRQWNGRIFIGMPYMYNVYLNGANLVIDEEKKTIYFTYSYYTEEYTRMWIEWSGVFKTSNWNLQRKEWSIPWTYMRTRCGLYGLCGPFGICKDSGSQICVCMQGFEPKSIAEWSSGNWSGGCARKAQLNCSSGGKGNGFLKIGGVKMPDFSDWKRGVGDGKTCEDDCLKNCSCIAHAYVGGIGCMNWGGDLMDIEEFSSGGENDLYIRLADSELGGKRGIKAIIIVVMVVLGLLIIVLCAYIYRRWMTKQRESGRQSREQACRNSLDEDILLRGMVHETEGPELPMFDFRIIANSTDHFSHANKLGEGGFGPVYKGNLQSGEEIAVKRLSKSSGQGLEEFKNEVKLISKLQHRNLVKILGCCIEGEEKLLIYEYMPNKSLDVFLFDPSQQSVLDWAKRFHIVEGIARGLLYLHRDSRLKIIHRDLKASNILLDEGLQPKISDFGMARIFGGDQNLARTNRVVGTYGYMSPEYAMEGRFSEKSDVFSFGVLLLEIVSGKRNSGSFHHEDSLSLLGHAWLLWNQNKVLEMIDPGLRGPFSQSEVLRCIHIGLLCVQQFATDRPTMASVVFMLGSDIANFPIPKQPAFTERRSPLESDSSQRSCKICSVNEVTVTIIQGR
ncbi:G-type lectin S-receptor-like serine/threonine-protein kinase At1g11330 isoform X1 [Magnolia sinica]|uniref:G-type lectin S-receptor-like serine/threonine-protein kinase At1g11330 isoform X1 n=2 Tax=Magnolia sinica TaxID=86752 RepID=UPI002659B7F6|nr:G-type lectin S-receptor-like serine/threonine-protein kinase At1g11330 isoform X1 [Magnolia sinica]